MAGNRGTGVGQIVEISGKLENRSEGACTERHTWPCVNLFGVVKKSCSVCVSPSGAAHGVVTSGVGDQSIEIYVLLLYA